MSHVQSFPFIFRSHPSVPCPHTTTEWINSRLLDEKLFPTDDDTPYPASFLAEVSDIYKRLFRVFAHLYHHHYEDVKAINALPHLNTCFKHFICFVQEFRLVDAAELAPLKQLIEKF